MQIEITPEERESKILHLQNKFRGDFGKVHARFVAQMIIGMGSSGSVCLTEIARALKEDVPLPATRKRLSRNLALEKLEVVIGDKVLRQGSKTIDPDTLLVVATSRVKKKYAKSMEYLDTLEDEFPETDDDKQTVSKGYSLCDVASCEPGSRAIGPLAQVLWSGTAPDAVSEIDQILSLVDRVRSATEGRGIIACRCSRDHRDLLVPWTEDSASRYVIRISDPELELLYKKEAVPVSKLARACELPYGDVCRKVSEFGLELSNSVQFGHLPVRLPECPDRPLWLVVLDSPTIPDRLVILTTEPMRRNRRVVQWVVQAEHAASTAEQTIRLHRLAVDFNDVRVLGYRSLKNMAALAFLQSSLVAQIAPELVYSQSRLNFKICEDMLSPSGDSSKSPSLTLS